MRTATHCGFAAAVFGAALALGGPLFAQPTITVAGQVVDAAGAPLAGITVHIEETADAAVSECCGPYRIVESAGDGSFHFEVHRSLWALTAFPDPPLTPTFLRADARDGSVTGLRLVVDAQTYSYLSDDPPKGYLIDVSPPDAAGMVSLTGAAGAVLPRSFVLVQTLETGHVGNVEAAADGSFQLRHFAPAGTAVLVKADPVGLVRRRTLWELTFGGSGNFAPLSSTILHVPPTAGASDALAFAVTGLVEDQRYPYWTFRGAISVNRLERGATLSVSGTLRLASSVLDTAGDMSVGIPLSLEMLAGADGHGVLAQALFASSVLTSTGLPIERRAFSEANGSFRSFPVVRTSPGVAEATIVHSLRVPDDLPDGWYRPVMRLFFSGVPSEPESDSLRLLVRDKLSRTVDRAYLPLVRLGSPAPPRLPLTLLAETPSGGSSGPIALEDRASFGLSPRFVTHSQRHVVPREHRSGKPILYSLEPFAPTVSIGDRGISPSPPLIPFRFPSGSLEVEIERPDGSVEHLGPAPFRQSRSLTQVGADGVSLGGDAGHPTDTYQLSTMDPRFAVTFAQDGRHRIRMQATIEDVWGNLWRGGGTYELYVARSLVLDTAVLPGTGFEVGDSFAPAAQLYPPLPADIEVRFTLAPGEAGATPIERVVRGRANRFGWFDPVGGAIALPRAGEYRVDLVASYLDAGGHLWMGSQTWGGVVAPRDTPLIAHGRRGVEAEPAPRPAWFFHPQGQGQHVFIPFHGGDVQWASPWDAALATLTVQDTRGDTAELLFERYGTDQTADDFASGEIPLVSQHRRPGFDLHADPAGVDLWGYGYVSIQRPAVRVREHLIETHEGMPSLYWRFHEHYGKQSGVGRDGDLPNDLKFQLGGAVVRGDALPSPRYAIYGSLFVLVPNGDTNGGSRVFPPFQGNGGGPSGGPLMTLKGRAIDLFWHPTAVRPGSVLEIGDRVSFAGYFGPTLPCKLDLTVTSPAGVVRHLAGQANRIGWFYDTAFDFYTDEPGQWKVKVRGSFDGATSAGQVTAPFPSGDVLGTADGEFSFYVVGRDSPPLVVDKPEDSFVRPAEGALPFLLSNPAGASQTRVHSTTTMPGFLLEQGQLPGFGYSYDAPRLALDFPNLDLLDGERKAGVDTVTMSFLAAGKDGAGSDVFRARQLLLQGEELFAPPQERQWPCVPADTTLCLNQGRFAVTGTWRTAAATGVAHAVGLTADSGYFWFFGRDNVEVLVKALDACGVNQQFWVFAAGLTDVEVELRVRDTLTGNAQVYTNAAGTAFAPLQDTAAFPTCGAPPAPGPTPTFVPPTTTGGSSATCTPTPTALCLAAGRFRVEASWRTGAGASGQALASPLTADTGTFTFFDPANVEVVVKVLDACSFPGAPRFWVFAAGLTNVEVVLTVTDTKTGAVKTYTNPLNHAFRPVQDTAAFATCP